MIEKISYTYDDIREDILNLYRSHKDVLDSTNIEESNDYVTDEYMGRKAFENDLSAFFNIMYICVAMVELNLYDKYLFDYVAERIPKYKAGYFDPYLSDNENKVDLDKDIAIVEEYLKLH